MHTLTFPVGAIRRAAVSLTALCLSIPVLAQTPITVTAASYPIAPATVYQWQQLQAPTGTLTPLVAGPNQTWDFRALPLRGTPFTQTTFIAPPPNAAFPTATVAFNYTNLLGPLQVHGVEYCALTPQGYLDLGATVRRQAFSIGGTTGNSRDSVVVLPQNIIYQPAHILRAFPTTAGTVTNQSLRTVTNVTLTVVAFGFNQAPVKYVHRSTESDSVIAWGTLRIPVAGQNGGSAPIPVLLHRAMVISQDSFYVNGQPAPTALLSALGLTQGATTTSTYDSFQRDNAAQAVFSVSYTDPSRQQANFYASAEASIPLGLATALPAEAPADVWPNPVAAGQPLAVRVPGLTAPLSLTLADALGRPVLSALIRPDQAFVLPSTVAPGSYLLTAPLPDGRQVRRRVVVQP